MKNSHRPIKRRLKKAEKVINGLKKTAGIAGAASAGAVVFVKANGPQLVKQAPEIAKKVAAVAKNLI